MKEVSTIGELPEVPGIYAFYDGKHVAYVGEGGNLKERVYEHLVLRNTSRTTGKKAAKLNPDYVTQVKWWEDDDFKDVTKRKAAELVAFDVLKPSIRTDEGIGGKAGEQYKIESFKSAMKAKFKGKPSGFMPVLNLDRAVEKVLALEKSVAILQDRLAGLEKKLAKE